MHDACSWETGLKWWWYRTMSGYVRGNSRLQSGTCVGSNSSLKKLNFHLIISCFDVAYLTF